MASEDCAFGPIGFERVRDVAPGEMVIIDEDGRLISRQVAPVSARGTRGCVGCGGARAPRGTRGCSRAWTAPGGQPAPSKPAPGGEGPSVVRRHRGRNRAMFPPPRRLYTLRQVVQCPLTSPTHPCPHPHPHPPLPSNPAPCPARSSARAPHPVHLRVHLPRPPRLGAQRHSCLQLPAGAGHPPGAAHPVRSAPRAACRTAHRSGSKPEEGNFLWLAGLGPATPTASQKKHAHRPPRLDRSFPPPRIPAGSVGGTSTLCAPCPTAPARRPSRSGARLPTAGTAAVAERPGCVAGKAWSARQLLRAPRRAPSLKPASRRCARHAALSWACPTGRAW